MNKLIDIKNFTHLKNESPDLDIPFFKINKKSKTKKKILIVSGGSRNGNHLVCSILDNHPQLPFLPGEDRVLSEIFWKNLNDRKNFYKAINNKNAFKYLSKLSGVNVDKWKLLSKKKIHIKYKKRWAGNHPQGFVPLLEYPDQKYFKFDHDKYLNTLKKNISSKSCDFEKLFIGYLEAFSKLKEKKTKDLKFDYIYANSGLRRELYLLCKKKFNVKIIVPVRKFETFCFSKIYGRYKSLKINDKLMKEAWAHWKNKTIDYLILKKLFPKNLFLVRFEDLIEIKNKKKFTKKICKFLSIKYHKNLEYNSFIGNIVKPNTSFEREKLANFAVLDTKLIPREYYNIYSEVEKKCY